VVDGIKPGTGRRGGDAMWTGGGAGEGVRIEASGRYVVKIGGHQTIRRRSGSGSGVVRIPGSREAGDEYMEGWSTRARARAIWFCRQDIHPGRFVCELLQSTQAPAAAGSRSRTCK